ncbi:MAG: DUF871 domain-containing protein, partial [Atopobium sp.]|nr:DUF871 domain-containing protein [Atopobium sp.]
GKETDYGISIYTDFIGSLDDIDHKLNEAHEIGYTEVFTSLELNELGFENTVSGVTEKTKHLLNESKKLGITVHTDVNRNVLESLDVEPGNLSFIRELGIPVLRIDGGYDAEEIALMTQNPYQIMIEDNLSDCMQYKKNLECVLKKGNIKQYCACHNFYPKPNTGLSLRQVCDIARYAKHNSCRTSVFIGSDACDHRLCKNGHGVLTVEELRWIPANIQAEILRAENCFDCIIFGDADPSADEMKSVAVKNHCVSELMNKNIQTSISDDRMCGPDDYVIDIPVYWENIDDAIVKRIQSNICINRMDSPEMMIRSTNTRGIFEIKPALTVRQKPGTITMTNILAGHYKGEINIALTDIDSDETENCIGIIKPYAMKLLKYVSEQNQPFRLV